jgi:hypothetical protein
LVLLAIEFSSFIGEWPEREREDSTFSAAMEDILVLVAKVARHVTRGNYGTTRTSFYRTISF